MAFPMGKVVKIRAVQSVWEMVDATASTERVLMAARVAARETNVMKVRKPGTCSLITYDLTIVVEHKKECH